MPSVRAVAAALAEFAPPSLAESWDNVGLLVGDPAADVDRVLAAYEVTDAVLDEAAACRAAMLVVFHPPIFKPLSRLTADDAMSRLVWRAAAEGRHLYATHTALDVANPGTSDFLAEALGVSVDGTLVQRSDTDVKLVVFVPEDAIEDVADALGEAGAGRIGAYDRCAFRARGQGTFRPLAGANPAIGQVGELEVVDEVRLETVVPRRRLAPVVSAMVAAHPYEEVAYDLVPLANSVTATGMGRIGDLPEPMSLAAFAERVETACGALHLRLVGESTRRVQRVALVGGSGASFIGEAARAGADVLVTGDVKHHDALLAARLGLALADPGHWATERFVVPATAAWLRDSLADVDVVESAVDGEPFTRR